MNHVLKESLTVLSGVIIVFLVLFSSIFLYFHLQNENRMSFQKYEFTKLQPGIHATTVELSEIDQPPADSYRNLIMKTNNKNWIIGQSKRSPEKYSREINACNSGDVKNAKCRELVTPKGQKYLISTSYSQVDLTKPFIQEITWLKNNETRIWFTLRKDEVEKYTDESWGAIIDSTAPNDFSDIKAVKVQPYGA